MSLVAADNPTEPRTWLLHLAALLRPSDAENKGPSKDRGRRECRALAATHGPPADKKQAAVTTGPAEHPAFPARWVYVLYVLSLVRRAFWPPYPREAKLRRVSDNAQARCAGYQRRGIRTTRFQRPRRPHTGTTREPFPAHRSACTRPVDLARRDESSRPPHPTPRVVTTRTPLVSRRDGADKTTDLGGESREILVIRIRILRPIRTTGDAPFSRFARARRVHPLKIHSASSNPGHLGATSDSCRRRHTIYTTAQHRPPRRKPPYLSSKRDEQK